jgi:hypothetical protein
MEVSDFQVVAGSHDPADEPSDPNHWPRTSELLRATCERRGGTVYAGKGHITLTHSGDGEPIRVTDFGEDGARIETGWIVNVLADCDEHADRPPDVVQIVEGIMDGGAEEVVFCTDSGRWVGKRVIIRYPLGERRSGTEQPPQSRAYTRRIPAWR